MNNFKMLHIVDYYGKPEMFSDAEHPRPLRLIGYESARVSLSAPPKIIYWG